MAQKQVKYLVTKSTYGFRGRYWTEGEVVEFPPDVVPDKRYFEVITKNTVLPIEADIDKPANTLADQVARPYKKEPTAGDVFKDQRHPGEVPLSARDRAL